MNTYRSLQAIEAVQYEGSPIPEVTCSGDGGDQKRYGCTGLVGVPHVHTSAIGGAHRLEVGDWIFPAPKGGPFDVASDKKFRAYWEVPVPVAPIEPEIFSDYQFGAEQSSQPTGEEKEEGAEADQSEAGAEVSEQPLAGETPLPADQIIFVEPEPTKASKQ